MTRQRQVLAQALQRGAIVVAILEDEMIQQASQPIVQPAEHEAGQQGERGGEDERAARLGERAELKRSPMTSHRTTQPRPTG